MVGMRHQDLQQLTILGHDRQVHDTPGQDPAVGRLSKVDRAPQEAVNFPETGVAGVGECHPQRGERASGTLVSANSAQGDKSRLTGQELAEVQQVKLEHKRQVELGRASSAPSRGGMIPPEVRMALRRQWFDDLVAGITKRSAMRTESADQARQQVLAELRQMGERLDTVSIPEHAECSNMTAIVEELMQANGDWPGSAEAVAIVLRRNPKLALRMLARWSPCR